MKDNSFSNFIRNGTPEKKKEVYNEVINESIQDQKQSMTSTIEKEGNELPHNTTEAQIKGILNEITNYDEFTGVEKANMVYAMEVYGNKRHNLALQQVLEELEETHAGYDKTFEDGSKKNFILRDVVKSIITSLQKE